MISVVDSTRIHILNSDSICAGGCVVYWMQKDQRADDNWALVYAIERANEQGVPLVVIFALTDRIANNYVRHYDFMLKGLAQTAAALKARGISFVMRLGYPPAVIAELAIELRACEVVTDESYLRLGRTWRQQAAERLAVRLISICAHLIVPVEAAAEKQMVGVYVLRPRLNKLISHYLTDYPDLRVLHKWKKSPVESLADQDPGAVMRNLDLQIIPAVTTIKPGSQAAQAILDELVDGRLQHYWKRNDPGAPEAQSGLSPYLHYGQISAQRVLYDIVNSPIAETHPDVLDSFTGELLVWRELANNYVYYNDHYRSPAGASTWAQAQLEKHADDPRDFSYSRGQWEQAQTHDALWNAAQIEMVKTGKMHNYLRMYWAKKILEWSASPSEAVATAVYLNDKYELDGREPNGYAGILWAITGLHDRPWFERPVYGQIS